MLSLNNHQSNLFREIDVTKNQWSGDKVEVLNECPVCRCKNSSVLFSSLIDMMSDNIFDKWTIKRCSRCCVAYLSPRPKEDNIHQAYSNYYTHSSGSHSIKKEKVSLLLSYLKKTFYNVKYKKKASIQGYILYYVIVFIFPLYLFLDAKIRHIGPLDNNKKKLLDIGCGNGDFLFFAKGLGWDVTGIDLDPNAVNTALSKDLNVRTGDVFSIKQGEMFDMISLSHVVEHVYNPAELIEQCYYHLNPGGKLWLETPNINSIGLNVYKEYWRGLEPPRHLMIYNETILTDILKKTGFKIINKKIHGLSGIYMGIQSEKYLDQFNGCRSLVYRKIFKYPRIIFVEIMQLLFKRKSEFITLIAYK